MSYPMNLKLEPAQTLLWIKLLHTAIWLFFASCIVAIPIAGALRQFPLAAVLAGMVLLECIVLAMNRGRCPISNLADQFTKDRRDNFDIYLPAWLARHNKEIFGMLFVVGGSFTLARWLIAGH
jgi:hypothetical protein